MDAKRVETQFDSKTVSMETGKLAKQAKGAIVYSIGDTTMLVTGVASPDVREGIDFFPLTVEVEERVYSVGRIPGAVFRREGRPTEKAILTARLTDRPIRPSFPDWFRHETQIICTILQFDEQNPYDAHTITAASAALTLSGVPFAGPISGVRIGHIHGRWVPFPTLAELENATIELIVAGRDGDDGNVDILMIESGGFEHTLRLVDEEGAPAPTEELLVEGLEVAKGYIKQLCDLQRQLTSQCEIPEREWVRTVDYGDDVLERVRAMAADRIREALQVSGKQQRNDAIDQVRAEIIVALGEEFPDREKEIKNAFKSVQKEIIRKRIVTEGRRIDDRGPKDLRPLYAEVGLLSRAHGTGLFQRGETQVLSVATLAMPRMEQFIGVDELLDKTKRFMHHYNFPPFSTGEAYMLRGPRRREIGHGALGEKALLPVVPSDEEFPYAIRVVAEVLESNGSTSMASTCASCLALMDAGVPVRDMVGGIAMGLIAEDGKYIPLTDILGAEDAYGDMDFKVAGTERFVTALQLDTKTTGISADVLGQALQQAKEARLEILAAMRKALERPRSELSPFAPRIITEQIPVDKIGEVIGPKGKIINEIIAKTETQIDIEDDGRVLIASTDGEGADEALRMIREIVSPRQLEIGDEFEGTVVKTTDFGAFVNLMPGRDGLVHISKLAPKGQRIERVEDVVKVGDKLRVKVNEIRADGKLNLVPARDGAADAADDGEGGSANGQGDQA